MIMATARVVKRDIPLLSSEDDYVDVLRFQCAFKYVIDNADTLGIGTPDATGARVLTWNNLKEAIVNNYASIKIPSPSGSADINAYDSKPTEEEVSATIYKVLKLAKEKDDIQKAVNMLHSDPSYLAEAYAGFKENQKKEEEETRERAKQTAEEMVKAGEANKKAKRKRAWSVVGMIATGVVTAALGGGYVLGALTLAGGFAGLASIATMPFALLATVGGVALYALGSRLVKRIFSKLKNAFSNAKSIINGDEDTLGSKKNLAKLNSLMKGYTSALSMSVVTSKAPAAAKSATNAKTVMNQYANMYEQGTSFNQKPIYVPPKEEAVTEERQDENANDGGESDSDQDKNGNPEPKKDAEERQDADGNVNPEPKKDREEVQDEDVNDGGAPDSDQDKGGNEKPNPKKDAEERQDTGNNGGPNPEGESNPKKRVVARRVSVISKRKPETTAHKTKPDTTGREKPHIDNSRRDERRRMPDIKARQGRENEIARGRLKQLLDKPVTEMSDKEKIEYDNLYEETKNYLPMQELAEFERKKYEVLWNMFNQRDPDKIDEQLDAMKARAKNAKDSPLYKTLRARLSDETRRVRIINDAQNGRIAEDVTDEEIKKLKSGWNKTGRALRDYVPQKSGHEIDDPTDGVENG